MEICHFLTPAGNRTRVLVLIKRSKFHWATDASVAQWNFDRLIKTRTRVRFPAGVRKWQISILADPCCASIWSHGLWVLSFRGKRIYRLRRVGKIGFYLILKSSRELLNSLPATMVNLAKEPGQKSNFHWAIDASMAQWKFDFWPGSLARFTIVAGKLLSNSREDFKIR